MNTARLHFDAQDYRGAYLLLDQYVKEQPGNLEARRMLAQVHEISDPVYALQIWEQLTESEPRTVENLVGYARLALRLGYTEKLPAVLDRLAALRPDSAELHRLSAGLALARADQTMLRREVEALDRIEPDNASTRFTLALLMLKSGVEADVAEARVRLETYARADGPPRIRATLALIADAPRRWPGVGEAGRRLTLLAARLGAGISGMSPARRFLVSRDGRPDESGRQDLVAHMQAQAGPSAADAVALAQWMIQVDLARDALLWLDTLDGELRRSRAVLDAMTACAIRLEAWPRLERLLAAGAWGAVPPGVIRHAFSARSLRAAGSDSQSSSAWGNAARMAEQSPVALRVLHRLARIWRWPERQTQVLWLLVNQSPAERWAWNTLVQLALEADSSAQLWRVYQAWGQAAPAVLPVQAERVLLGLLIRPAEPGLPARAAELFTQNPAMPAARVAQALALWRTGRLAEAQAMLEAGSVGFASEPRFALVRGLVLAHAGQPAEAERMFALAGAGRLLSEEKALIAAARSARP